LQKGIRAKIVNPIITTINNAISTAPLAPVCVNGELNQPLAELDTACAETGSNRSGQGHSAILAAADNRVEL
jgi:hypothetical protein